MDCKSNYTRTDSGKCEACDKACKHGCTGLGKENCLSEEGCNDGFRLNENNICDDIDECTENPEICANGEVCRNSYGSFHCIGKIL